MDVPEVRLCVGFSGGWDMPALRRHGESDCDGEGQWIDGNF